MKRKMIVHICEDHYQLKSGHEWIDYSHNLKYLVKLKRKNHDIKFIKSKCPLCNRGG